MQASPEIDTLRGRDGWKKKGQNRITERKGSKKGLGNQNARNTVEEDWNSGQGSNLGTLPEVVVPIRDRIIGFLPQHSRLQITRTMILNRGGQFSLHISPR